MAVVQYRAILDVRFPTDTDAVDVATHYHPGPDAALRPDVHVADHQALWIEPCLGIDRGCVIVECADVAHVHQRCCRYSRSTR